MLQKKKHRQISKLKHVALDLWGESGSKLPEALLQSAPRPEAAPPPCLALLSYLGQGELKDYMVSEVRVVSG